MAQYWEMAVEFRNRSLGSLFSKAWNSSVGKNTGAEWREAMEVRLVAPPNQGALKPTAQKEGLTATILGFQKLLLIALLEDNIHKAWLQYCLSVLPILVMSEFPNRSLGPPQKARGPAFTKGLGMGLFPSFTFLMLPMIPLWAELLKCQDSLVKYRQI